MPETDSLELRVLTMPGYEYVYESAPIPDVFKLGPFRISYCNGLPTGHSITVTPPQPAVSRHLFIASSKVGSGSIPSVFSVRYLLLMTSDHFAAAKN